MQVRKLAWPSLNTMQARISRITLWDTGGEASVQFQPRRVSLRLQMSMISFGMQDEPLTVKFSNFGGLFEESTRNSGKLQIKYSIIIMTDDILSID